MAQGEEAHRELPIERHCLNAPSSRAMRT